MKQYVDPESVTARRVQRLLGFCRIIDDGKFPDALDVAFELSQRHVDGGSVSLAGLLVEAGLASDLAEGRRVSQARTGRELAEHLATFHWQPVRSAAERKWQPPVTRREGCL